MTVTPDTAETPAVQIALEARRDQLFGERPDLVAELAGCQHRAAELQADIDFIDRQLVELDAALAARPTAGYPVMMLHLPGDAVEFMRRSTGPAVMVLQSTGVPALLVDRGGLLYQAFTPEHDASVGFQFLAYPLAVVQR